MIDVIIFKLNQYDIKLPIYNNYNIYTGLDGQYVYFYKDSTLQTDYDLNIERIVVKNIKFMIRY